MYSEAKLAFFIYLWYPRTEVWHNILNLAVNVKMLFVFSMNFALFQGATYIYHSFFRPIIAKHETDIDGRLLEFRTRAGDVAVLYSQKAVVYGQTRFFKTLQYVGSQSNSEPQSRRDHPSIQVSPHKDT